MPAKKQTVRNRLLKKLKPSAHQKMAMTATHGKRSAPKRANISMAKVNKLVNQFIANAIKEVVAQNRIANLKKRLNRVKHTKKYLNTGKNRPTSKRISPVNRSGKRLARKTGFVKNPASGRWVKLGGSVHKNLMARGYH